jgi:hypothetical protein
MGALPPQRGLPRIRLANHLLADYPAPEKVDYLSAVPSWPMYANDQYGDCVWAAIGHEIQAQSRYGQGQEIQVSEAALLQGYSDVTGFDPNDPSTDQGTNLQAALKYWRTHGIEGHKILAFAEVNVADKNEVDAAIAIFGAIEVAFGFPRSAMDQFNQGKPWDVNPKDPRPTEGHAIHGGFYDMDKEVRRFTTWGNVQDMTDAFWEQYVWEAWALITPEWLDKTSGHSPGGLDLYGLGEELERLTGERNPFPKPPPPPAPPTDNAEAVLRQALTAWLARRHTSPGNKALEEPARRWLSSL